MAAAPVESVVEQVPRTMVSAVAAQTAAVWFLPNGSIRQGPMAHRLQQMQLEAALRLLVDKPVPCGLYAVFQALR